MAQDRFHKTPENSGVKFLRRQFLQGSLASFFAMTSLSQTVQAVTKKSPLLGFPPISASTADAVRVPVGYQAEVLISWGDPLFAEVPCFNPLAISADTQIQQFGDNNDGMSLFEVDDNHAVLVVNNEYPNMAYLFPHQGKAMTTADVATAQVAVGVSVLGLTRQQGQWQPNKMAVLNRRITANTPMDITGPAAGDGLLCTADDPTGRQVLGTFANCANGKTPWQTYLTCEENFDDFFGAVDDNTSLSPAAKRYGLKHSDPYYHWSQFDSRFDMTANPNEPNRFGWVVEIDPFDPTSTPKKRTALGRFKHENAALVVEQSGHVVVYMGDDARGEYLYKFVSTAKYTAGAPQENSRLLDEGTLYAATFSGTVAALKGAGEWLALVHGENGLTVENGFANQAAVLIHARLAADHVRATKMDRPEWVAVHPDKRSVFCTLTNNKKRGKQSQPANAANPRINNIYGHIIRWQPRDGDHTESVFEWDIYLLAGNPAVHSNAAAGTANITEENMFNSPDGLGFDAAGRLWILTDGKTSDTGDFAGMGNNQMLCGDPVTGEIRRFLTGPVGSEITGLAFSADSTTLFVGVQHPGEWGSNSHFPGGADSMPRSSVMCITRKDGGVIGS